MPDDKTPLPHHELTDPLVGLTAAVDGALDGEDNATAQFLLRFLIAYLQAKLQLLQAFPPDGQYHPQPVKDSAGESL